MRREVWIVGAIGAGIVLVVWLTKVGADPTSAPTSLIVGNAGLTPLIDDLSDGTAVMGSTAKAIV
jgi:hypothetical protein